MLRRQFLKLLGSLPVAAISPKTVISTDEFKIRDKVEIRVQKDNRWKNKMFDKIRYKQYIDKVRIGTIEKINKYISTEESINKKTITVQKLETYCIRVDGINEIQVFYGNSCLTKI